MQRRHVVRRLASLACLAVGTPRPAESRSSASPPLPGSLCRSGQLVPAEFSKAAIRKLRQLIITDKAHASHGAIRRSLGAAHVDVHGTVWHHVAAYEGNLGLIGALRIDPTLRREAGNWLRWQAARLVKDGPQRGYLYDHWAQADGMLETTLPPGTSGASWPRLDAVDSTLATFFLMAQAYLRHGGDREVLKEPAMWEAFAVAANTLAGLQQVDGLTLAKAEHPVAYLMDAVEVGAGWRALAELQATVWADLRAARRSRMRAKRTQDAVDKLLWDDGAGLWRTDLAAGTADLNRWYPDTMAQIWPLLWSGPGGNLSFQRSLRAWAQVAAQWQTPKRNWVVANMDPAGFWWPAVAVAAHCAGDAGATQEWLTRAEAAWRDPQAPFAWPFQVSDLLWLLWLADPLPSGVMY